MTKNLLACLTLLLLLQTALNQEPKAYDSQGQLELVPNILNFGYSPDQRNLVVLTTDALNTFVFYEGLRLNSPKIVNITDEGDFKIKPSAFAFSQNGAWLVIGTSYGAVYGYRVTEGKIADKFDYKK
jgi:hypothetical protein